MPVNGYVTVHLFSEFPPDFIPVKTGCMNDLLIPVKTGTLI